MLGDIVRYDAKPNPCAHPLLSQWSQNNQLIKLCPEVIAGLPTPRPAAEIQNGDGSTVLGGVASVRLKDGRDITGAFLNGAQIALDLAKRQHIQFALLKSNSPSCGNDAIYNGAFNGTLRTGPGVTAALLVANNIQVFNEHQLEALELAIKTFELNQFI